MASGKRDANSVVVMQGVHYETGEIVPIKIDNTTGYVLITVLGVPASTVPTLREDALHDDNNVPTIVLTRDDTGDRACPLIDNRNGALWAST